MNAAVESVLTKFLGAHQWVYEHTGGRIGRSLGGRPMLLLRTVGARTKQPRTAALLYVPDGSNYAVIASKGGDPRHPGWFHNLQANPAAEVQVGTKQVPVHARVADGDERARLWSRANGINKGGYDRYQEKTDRRIPVVVLEPRAS
jgi:F420H(2)-dependent quinone reductase